MPVLHLLAGSNGSGKSSYVEDVLEPATYLEFVNADVLAKRHWPDAQAEHAYDASRLAAERRAELMSNRASFITETVFSHESKLELVRDAVRLGYLVHLHVILLPVELTVQRVTERVTRGGHTVPETKIRERYARLWDLIAQARSISQRTEFFDNSSANTPFLKIAEYEHGTLVGKATWPTWTPGVLRKTSDP